MTTSISNEIREVKVVGHTPPGGSGSWVGAPTREATVAGVPEPYLGRETRSPSSLAARFALCIAGGVRLSQDRFHFARDGGAYLMEGNTLRERYEAEVGGLASLRDEWLSAGMEVEQVARRLHRKRRAIGVRYKLRTSPFGKRGQFAIYRRNLRKYGASFRPLG